MFLHHHILPFLLGDPDGPGPVVHQGARPRARALPPQLEPARGRRHAPRRTAARAKARLARAFGHPPRRHARRFYVGRLDRAQPEVFVVDAAVRRLKPPGPFGWGTPGAASRHLAEGLLRDATGRQPSRDHVRRFADDVVTRLPGDGFVLPAEFVQRWLSLA
jgi:hypothetical protein